MKYLLFTIALLSGSIAWAQNPLKKYPAKPYLFIHEKAVIFNANFVDDKRMKDALVGGKILTEEQFQKVLTYSQIEQYPEAINTTDKLLSGMKNDWASFVKYKGFWIGSWIEFFPLLNDFRRLHIYWLPKEDNLDNAAGYIPKTENGFYVISRFLWDDPIAFIPPLPSSVKPLIKKLDAAKLSKEENTDKLSPVPDNLENFYPLLKNKFHLTDDEIEMVSQHASEEAWPDSISFTPNKYKNRSAISSYSYYKLGEVQREYALMGLYWIPPGQNFAPGYSPKSDFGYFFCSRISDKKGNSKPYEADIAFLNSPWWIKNVSNSAYTSATYRFPVKNSSNTDVAATTNGNNSASNNSGFTVTTVNGITIAKGNLTRRNKRNGVFFIFWGTGGKVKHCTVFFSEFDAKEEEVSVIKSYMSNYSDGTPFMSYSFMEGENCQSTRVRNTIKAVGCNGCSGY
ncbi:MAG: hypothetical protein U0V75_02995 [Ferruginibacter sp.]